MRKILLIIFFLSISFCAFAQKVEFPVGWVNDFAGVIDKEDSQKMTSLIEELRQKTSAEIMVVSINSIVPYDEKDYARAFFDSWKPGKKGADNGVLVFLAVKERRWRIETGYGVEGILPDGLCGEIGRTYMVPNFKAGNYGLGLYEGVSALANVIAKNANVTLATLGNFKEQAQTSESSPTSTEALLRILLPFAVIIIITIISSVSSGGRNYGGGYYGRAAGVSAQRARSDAPAS